MDAGSLAAARLTGGEGERTTDELYQGVAQGQHTIVRMHAAKDVNNADVANGAQAGGQFALGVPGGSLQGVAITAVLRPQGPERQSQQHATACGQCEQQPLWQCFKCVPAVAHTPEQCQLADAGFKRNHHQPRGHAADHAQQRVGERRLIVGQVAAILAQQSIEHGVWVSSGYRPILPVNCSVNTFILGGRLRAARR